MSNGRGKSRATITKSQILSAIFFKTNYFIFEKCFKFAALLNEYKNGKFTPSSFNTGRHQIGHLVCIDNFGILHTLEQHGNPLSEARRGQIAVAKEDFVKYLDVFLNPDEIQLSGKTKRTNLPLLQFTKMLEDKKFVVKEVRTVVSTKKKKVSRLVLHTMYKIKVSK